MGIRKPNSDPPTGGDELADVVPPSAGIPVEAESIPEIAMSVQWDGEEDELTASVRQETLPPPIGRVGRFDVLGRLAVGGMAEIFLARQSGEADTSRLLVIKFIRTSLGDDPQMAELFEREARVVMRLAHPNICHVYEVGKWRGRHFIAMEWVHGVTMRDLYRTARSQSAVVPVPVVVKVIAQVAEALDFAHRARDRSGRPLGIVHRDISPMNIMVSYDGVVKLVDFGVAKIDTSVTHSGTIKGKFAYMSPEQAQAKHLDSRSDIFSLGIVLWEMLTGRRAYQLESQFETLRAIVERELPPARSINPSVPEELDRILARCLKKERDDRYSSAVALQEDLAAFLVSQKEVVNASRISRLMRDYYGETSPTPKLDRSNEASGSFVGGIEPQAPLGGPPPATGTPRRRVPWATLTLLGLLLGGAAAVLLVVDPFGFFASPASPSDTAVVDGPTESPPVESEPIEPPPEAAADEAEVAEEISADEPDTPPEERAVEPEAAEEAPALAEESTPERSRNMRTESMRQRQERQRAASESASDPEPEPTMMRSRFVTSPF